MVYKDENNGPAHQHGLAYGASSGMEDITDPFTPFYLKGKTV